VDLESDIVNDRLFELYKQRILSKKPLSSANIESFMLALNSFPGKNFRALLEPNLDKNGTVTLLLKEEKEPGTGVISIDNYASRFLGPYQTTLQYSDSFIPLQQTTITGLTTLHEVLKRNWGNFCFVAIILINILIPAVINEQVERSFF
jgi:hypothetical protein